MLPKPVDEFVTSFIEKVLIEDAPFELHDEHDQIVFQPLSENNSKKASCRPICIKKCEILFAQKSTEPRGLYPSNPFVSCSTFGRLNPHTKRIDNKELWRLADVRQQFKSKLCENCPISDESINSKRFDIIQNTAEIYLLARAKKFRWRVASLTCHFVNGSACDRWLAVLNGRIKDLSRPKNLLIFVNPFGGKGLALRYYQNFVEPLLKLCDINYKLLTTERANHARDVVLGDDLTPFDGIISVGGDGLLNEILNGLLIRTQIDNEIDVNSLTAKLHQAKLKLAAIPAGSVNAFAYTLNGTDDPLTAVLHVILGDRRSVDVCSIHHGSKFDRFACIAASFGFLGDVLQQSEKLRCLGPPRYLFAGIKMAIKYPKYKGRIELQPSKLLTPSSDVGESSILPENLCHADCTICGSMSRESGKKVPVTKSEENANPVDLIQKDEGPRELPKMVVLENATLLHLIGIITPALCKLSPRGLSPTCHLGDGNMHVAIVEPISRIRNFFFMARVMGKNKQNHLMKRYVKLYEVTSFSFLPFGAQSKKGSENLSHEFNENETKSSEENKILKSDSSTKKDGQKSLGTWNIDGELLSQPDDVIHFRMHKQLISMFARGIELNKEAGDV